MMINFNTERETQDLENNDKTMIEFCVDDEKKSKLQAVIKVIGLGGGGGNAVKHMAKKYSDSIDYICANTDTQALENIDVGAKIRLGLEKTTQGLGAGMRHNIGKEAALESEAEIKQSILGADILFITAGMGGGTGTGSAPVVADIAKKLGILTIAVVTKPFTCEGKKRMRIAEEGIKQLINRVDSLIILPNDRLVDTPALMNVKEAFARSDDVLANSVHSVTEITTESGEINIDFADIRTVMSMPGKAMIGFGVAKGDDRATQAINRALSNPLVEEVNLRNAKGMLVNVMGSKIRMDEITDIGNVIEEYAHDDADIKIGYVDNESMGDNIKVSIIATGLEDVDSTSDSASNDTSNICSSMPAYRTTPVIEANTASNLMTPEMNMPNYLDRTHNMLKIPAYLRNR